MKKILLASFFLALSLHTWAQDRTVTGKVTSAEDGSGLPGVNVLLKGSTSGAVTDLAGNYSIQAPQSGGVLIFSFIGLVSQEVEIGSRSTIDISMVSDVTQLTEVVVTALGIERDTRSLGYSVQKVKSDEIIKSGEVNLVQGLSSKVAGVQVIGSGGTPGASSKILIRGARSFTGQNQPLFVVDGVPISNGTENSEGGDYPFNENLQGVNQSNRAIDINPNDIETLTVLKGPAAAALYGVRAANGAVIITTKKGTKGAPIVTVSSNVSFDQVNKLPEFQEIYAQGNGGGNQRNSAGDIITPTYDTNGLNGSIGTANSWGPKISSVPGIGFHDNAADFYQTGVTFTNNISLSGGGEKSAFRLGIGQLGQSGIIPNSEFNRYSVRLTGSSDISEKVSISGTANVIKSGGTRVQNGSNLAGVSLSLFRTPASYDLAKDAILPDGSFSTYFAPYDNPYWSVEKNPFTDDVLRTLGNFSVNYKPVDWINITYRVGGDSFTDKRKQIFSIYSNQPAGTGEIFEDIQTYREIYQDIIATGTKTFGNIFTSLSVGHNLNQRLTANNFSRARDLTIDGYGNLGNGSDLYADQSSAKVRSAAVFFDANASYNDLVFLGVTGRNEWSSTLGSQKNNFFYPSVNLALAFTELIPENSILTFGKVRVAYATSGNTPGAYATRTYYTQPFYTDGFTNGLSFPYLGQQGRGESTRLGNDNLKPEILTGFELGTNLRLLRDRVNIDFTYYSQKSSDIILFRPLASSTGYTEVVDNSGEMVNKGIEIVASVDWIKSNDFVWTTSVNFTRNRNEVTKLAPGVDEISIEAAFSSIGSFAIVGQPYGAFYGTRFQKTDKGELIIGNNGLPVLNPIQGNIGDPNPDWLAGIRNTFSYKRIILSALMDIRSGGDIWNGTFGRLNNIGRSAISEDRDRDFVIPGVKDNGDGTFSQNTQAISAFNYYRSYLGDGPGGAGEQFVQDGSWVRLRELSLGYSIPNLKILKGLGDIEFTLSGRNLWLSTDYTGVDPETSLTGAGSNINGLDYFNNPSTRSFSFGVKATIK